ncbi:MAG: DnaD domain protein [Clostridia bacterium]|nr:DnaD domain protein [Clostridia bacterium]
MAFIGLKKNELVITRSRVKKTIEDTTALFRKYRPGNTPSALDHRMVFFCADKDGNTELLDYAFEQAQLAEKVNDWRYICGIIRSLRDRKITTVEQARQWDDLRPDQKGTEAEAVANNILENHRRQEAGK